MRYQQYPIFIASIFILATNIPTIRLRVTQPCKLFLNFKYSPASSSAFGRLRQTLEKSIEQANAAAATTAATEQDEHAVQHVCCVFKKCSERQKKKKRQHTNYTRSTYVYFRIRKRPRPDGYLKSLILDKGYQRLDCKGKEVHINK